MAGVCWTDLWGIAAARADGAFPASQSVLLPSDRPKQIILATTFGLVFSDDDGASWAYACEDPVTTRNASSYLLGPSPGNRIYAISSALGAAVSPDSGCSWTSGGGDLVNTRIEDVFPDPSHADRVFAIAVPQSVPNPTGALFRSDDGGLTYAMLGFAPEAGASLTGVEVAASNPNLVFATLDGSTDGSRPQLARSSDAGATFEVHELAGSLGAARVRLVGVDPADPSVLFLRLFTAPDVTPAGESLAMSRDGGDSWTTPVTLVGSSIVGFARLPTGTLVAVATSSTTAAGTLAGSVLLRSKDAGATFSSSPLGFVPTGLGTRAGVLFAAANEFPAGEVNALRFSLASSTDEGDTWLPRLKFSQISGVRACVKAACQSDCTYLAGLTLFPEATCSAGGGSTATGGAGGPSSGSSGGGCSLVRAAHPAGWGWLACCGAVAACALFVVTARARRRGTTPRNEPAPAPSPSSPRTRH